MHVLYEVYIILSPAACYVLGRWAKGREVRRKQARMASYKVMANSLYGKKPANRPAGEFEKGLYENRNNN